MNIGLNSLLLLNQYHNQNFLDENYIRDRFYNFHNRLNSLVEYFDDKGQNEIFLPKRSLFYD